MKRSLGLLLTIVIGVTPAIGSGTDEVAPDLANLSLEELSNIKITSVAKRQQRLSQVAAAVYVITHEDIWRSGLTSVADILRLAPGIHVARINGSQWSVSSRGFGSRFSNKLLVLVDGRSVYTPVFSGVYWDMSMPMIDDIDRIEVIRGPGASIWGANAVMGVINIITKSTRDTQGTLLTAGGGTSERTFGALRQGGRTGSIGYRGYISGAVRAQMQTGTGDGAADDWSSAQGGFRIDANRRSDSLMLVGDLFRNDRNEVSTVPSVEQMSILERRSHLTGTSWNLMGEWRRQFNDTDQLRVRSSYDVINRPENVLTKIETRTWDSELQYDAQAANAHFLSLGLGARVVSDATEGNSIISFNPASLQYRTLSVFGQDEIHLAQDRVLFTLGAKLEHNPFGGWGLEPNVRFLWAPTSSHTLWMSAGRALRTPTRYDQYADAIVDIRQPSAETFGFPVVISVHGNPEVANEAIRDYEAGYRAQLTPAIAFDLALYFNQFSKLQFMEVGNPSLVLGSLRYVHLPTFFESGSDGWARGAEVSASWRVFPDWKLAASYTNQTLQRYPDALHESALALPPVGQAPPQQQWKVQSYLNLTQRVQFDVLFFKISQVEVATAQLGSAAIPAYTSLDARIGFDVSKQWELSVSGQNLLQARHLELLPEALNAASYVTRGVYLKSTWRF